MAKKLFLGLALVLALASCVHNQRPAEARQLKLEAEYSLGSGAELRLCGDGNLSQVELYYGGELQEMSATANTDYFRNDAGAIVLDTVVDTAVAPAYVVRTYDRSSTYGAEVWYVVYPYRRDDPDGPWNLVKLPTDRPGVQDVAPFIAR